jgi:hypothetical protein
VRQRRRSPRWRWWLARVAGFALLGRYLGLRA